MVKTYRLACGILLATLFSISLPVTAQHVQGLTPERKDRIVMQYEGANAADIDLQVMFADGTLPVELPAHANTQRPRMTPTLAADGRTLAFAAMNGGRSRLFTWTLTSQNTAVGAPRQLSSATNTMEKFPAWSPDGQQLAYVASDGTSSTLRVIKRDGTGMRTLATVLHFATPAWAPNGESIFFLDKIGGKTLLKQVALSGGAVTVLRNDLPIQAVSVSPDGGQLALLIHGQRGQSELWVVPATGSGGSAIVKKIIGAKSVIWFTSESIVFGAEKLGAVSDGDVWMTDPKGKRLRGVPGYLGTKRVAHISIQRGDLSVSGLPGFDPNIPMGPDTKSSAPEQRLPSGPVMISRPVQGEVVRGKVPLKVIAQKGVVTVNIRVGEQFTYSTGVQTSADRAPEVAITWNSQDLKTPDTALPVPKSYRDLQMYPDGEYTVLVQGLDRDNNTIGSDTIKIRVQNTLPEASDFNQQVLRYNFDMKQRTLQYNIHGRGTLFGQHVYVAKELDAEFNAQMRRYLIEVKGGQADVRTRVITNALPLRYGETQISIPETNLSGRYAITSNGAFDVVPQMMRKVYLPLSQLAIPFSTNPVRVGSSWQGDMWVVPELLERRAMLVAATNTIEGIEIIGGRQAVRIRSDFRMNTNKNGFSLAISPATRAPGLHAGVPNKPDQAIPTQQADGVRFSWFDYKNRTLLRVEDIFYYAFRPANVPVISPPNVENEQQSMRSPNNPGMRPTTPGTMPPGMQGMMPPGMQGMVPPGMMPPGMPGGNIPSFPTEEETPVVKTNSHLTGTASYAVRYSYILDGLKVD